MALVQHSFASPKGDDPGQTTRVRPSDWNNYHTVDPLTFTAAHLANEATGLEFLGSTRVNTATNSITSTFAAREELTVMVLVVATSIADHVVMRFNSDSGSNYWDRILRANAPFIGQATIAQTMGGPLTQIRIHADSTANERIGLFSILNRSNKTKPMSWLPQAGSNSASAVSRVGVGLAEWVSTGSQITSITLKADVGTTTLSVGSGIVVLGRNCP